MGSMYIAITAVVSSSSTKGLRTCIGFKSQLHCSLLIIRVTKPLNNDTTFRSELGQSITDKVVSVSYYVAHLSLSPKVFLTGSDNVTRLHIFVYSAVVLRS